MKRKEKIFREADGEYNEFLEKGEGFIQKKVEKHRKKRWKRLVSTRSMYIGALFFALLAAGITYSGVLEETDLRISDSIHQRINRKRSISAIKIIAIDDKTIDYFGEYEDWSGIWMAAFLEKLNHSPEKAPQVIGIDLDCSKERDSVGAERLVKTCSKYDNICIGAPVISERKKDVKEEPASLHEMQEMDVKMPFAALKDEVVTGISNNTIVSKDGYVRSAVAGTTLDGTKMDSFAVAIYKLYRTGRGLEYTLPKVDAEQTFSFTYTKQSED